MTTRDLYHATSAILFAIVWTTSMVAIGLTPRGSHDVWFWTLSVVGVLACLESGRHLRTLRRRAAVSVKRIEP